MSSSGGATAPTVMSERDRNEGPATSLEGWGLWSFIADIFKIFKRMLGTNCSLTWREPQKESVFEYSPTLTQGIGDQIVIPNAEMYGERFDIPEPDESIFISWFEGARSFAWLCL